MSKSLFHTITIRIPKDQVYITKNNTVTIVPSLNKNNAITKRLKIPSIILKADEHIIHPVIENEGEEVNINEEKQKQKAIKKTLPKKEPKKKEPKKESIINKTREIIVDNEPEEIQPQPQNTFNMQDHFKNRRRHRIG
jgi:hypothetical protein